MSLLFPLNNHDERNRFPCLPKPAHSCSLLDIHATGLTLRVGAAVTAIAAALPSQKRVTHKKAQKAQNRNPFMRAQRSIIFCAFCAFLWLMLISERCLKQRKVNVS